MVSDHSEQGMYNINVGLPGLYYTFIQTHFKWPNKLHGDTELNKDIYYTKPPS
jgi:hypothetical protein